MAHPKIKILPSLQEQRTKISIAEKFLSSPEVSVALLACLGNCSRVIDLQFFHKC